MYFSNALGQTGARFQWNLSVFWFGRETSLIGIALPWLDPLLQSPVWRRLLRLEPLAAQFSERSPSRQDRWIISPFLSNTPNPGDPDDLNPCRLFVCFILIIQMFICSVTQFASKSSFHFFMNGLFNWCACAPSEGWNSWRKGRVPSGMTNSFYFFCDSAGICGGIPVHTDDSCACSSLRHPLVI